MVIMSSNMKYGSLVFTVSEYNLLSQGVHAKTKCIHVSACECTKISTNIAFPKAGVAPAALRHAVDVDEVVMGAHGQEAAI